MFGCYERRNFHTTRAKNKWVSHNGGAFGNNQKQDEKQAAKLLKGLGRHNYAYLFSKIFGKIYFKRLEQDCESGI